MRKESYICIYYSLRYVTILNPTPIQFTDNIIVLRKNKILRIMVNLETLNYVVIQCQHFLGYIKLYRLKYYKMLTYNVNIYLSLNDNIVIGCQHIRVSSNRHIFGAVNVLSSDVNCIQFDKIVVNYCSIFHNVISPTYCHSVGIFIWVGAPVIVILCTINYQIISAKHLII